MSEVVDFPGRDRGIWICGCGCQTHYVFEDGGIECASCGSEGPQGKWHLPDEGDVRETPEDLFSIKNTGSRFSFQRASQRVLEDEVVGVAIFFDDGGTSSVYEELPGDDATRDWWKRRAKEFLNGLGIKVEITDA